MLIWIDTHLYYYKTLILIASLLEENTDTESSYFQEFQNYPYTNFIENKFNTLKKYFYSNKFNYNT